MVEANRPMAKGRVAVAKKKAPAPVKGKKKGKKGAPAEEDDAQFLADLARAIEESKISAGLVDPLEDHVPGPDGSPRGGGQAQTEEQKNQERMAA